MIRIIAGLVMVLAANSVAAHDLRVFASVSGDTVVVEAKFSTGRVPKSGTIKLFDAKDALVGTLEVSPDGITRFPLPENVRDTGLRIDVEVGGGHSEYWLLTPDDIARGQEGN